MFIKTKVLLLTFSILVNTSSNRIGSSEFFRNFIIETLCFRNFHKDSKERNIVYRASRISISYVSMLEGDRTSCECKDIEFVERQKNSQFPVMLEVLVCSKAKIIECCLISSSEIKYKKLELKRKKRRSNDFYSDYASAHLHNRRTNGLEKLQPHIYSPRYDSLYSPDYLDNRLSQELHFNHIQSPANNAIYENIPKYQHTPGYKYIPRYKNIPIYKNTLRHRNIKNMSPSFEKVWFFPTHFHYNHFPTEKSGIDNVITQKKKAKVHIKHPSVESTKKLNINDKKRIKINENNKILRMSTTEENGALKNPSNSQKEKFFDENTNQIVSFLKTLKPNLLSVEDCKNKYINSLKKLLFQEEKSNKSFNCTRGSDDCEQTQASEKDEDDADYARENDTNDANNAETGDSENLENEEYEDSENEVDAEDTLEDATEYTNELEIDNLFETETASCIESTSEAEPDLSKKSKTEEILTKVSDCTTDSTRAIKSTTVNKAHSSGTKATFKSPFDGTTKGVTKGTITPMAEAVGSSSKRPNMSDIKPATRKTTVDDSKTTTSKDSCIEKEESCDDDEPTEQTKTPSKNKPFKKLKTQDIENFKNIFADDDLDYEEDAGTRLSSKYGVSILLALLSITHNFL